MTSPHAEVTAVAVVGCGAVADRYVDGLLADPTLDVVAAVDLDGGRATRVADRADCRAFDAVDAALDATDPDLVVNLTAHAAHAPVTRAALEADCDVFSEKPLATDVETARELVDLAVDRDRRLDCAPVSHRSPTARRLRTLLAEGRVGRPRLVDVHCHVGRMTEWHDRPDGFLDAGPLYDAAPYPLTVLTSVFGPVRRVRSADLVHLGDGRGEGDTPDHAVSTMTLGGDGADGADAVTLQLSASMYVPSRTRESVTAEVHGDDGSLYLADAGGLDRGDRDRVRLAPLGDGYVPVPIQGDGGGLVHADGPAAVAANRAAGPPVHAARARHVVAVVDAIERAAASGDPVDVPPVAGAPTDGGPFGPEPAPWPTATHPEAAPEAPPLPPVGFGCSRYRGDGEYVDLSTSIRRAVDAGYRLFDAAELYGSERTVGAALDRPGAPDRDAVTLASKLWNTNHEPERVRAACEASCHRLGVDRLDLYMLHWPDAWVHRGPLTGVADMSHEELEALAFPTDADGEPRRADVDLADTWAAMEALVDDGLVDRLGICNVDVDRLRTLRRDARIEPSVVQVESHPYVPRTRLVDWCHDHAIRVQAHSPLSAPGLLDEAALGSIAADHGVTPAQVALRWHVERGVVPLPSSTDPDHVVDNLDLFGFALEADERARIAALRDPDFSR